MAREKDTHKDDDKFSLHGMTPEEAIQRAFGVKPKQPADKAATDKLIEAFGEFSETGQCSAVCDVCGTPIAFKRVADHAHQSSCGCGKFNDTLRGI